MATDYQSLLNTARPSTAGANNASGYDQLKIGLLVMIANTLAPLVATDFQSLLRLAETPGYLSSSNTSGAQLLELALLNIIAQNVGSGGSGSGVTFGAYGGGQPSFTPASGTGVAYDTDVGTEWFYYAGAWH